MHLSFLVISAIVKPWDQFLNKCEELSNVVTNINLSHNDIEVKTQHLRTNLDSKYLIEIFFCRSQFETNTHSQTSAV